MTLGDVLAKERKCKEIAAAEVASKLELPLNQYLEWEAGNSNAEKWGPVLAKIAIALTTPISRLLAETGKAVDTKPGQAARLIAYHRTRKGVSPAQLAESAGCTAEELAQIELGESAIEEIGPQLLRFAELIGQPIFNLFYPCGLPLETIKNYP
jgi:transcriptional regulator with XRE-family HTH domain